MHGQCLIRALLPVQTNGRRRRKYAAELFLNIRPASILLLYRELMERAYIGVGVYTYTRKKIPPTAFP